MAEREYPEQTYFPSARVRLIIRFEEYTAELSTDLSSTRSNIRKGDGTGNVAQVDQTGGPQEQAASDDKLTQAIDGIIPKSASLSRNGIRQADTCRIDFKYGDMPLDPRTLRGVGIQLFIGTLKPDDFAAGVSGSTKPSSEGQKSGEAIPANMLPEKYMGPEGERTNLRFEGWIDDWEVNWSDSEPILTVSCTDNTRQLIDQPAPPQLTIDPKVPIDEAVKQYIDEFPQFQGFEVKFLPEDGDRPQLDAVTSKGSRKKGKGAAPGKGGGGAPGAGGQVSVWDYLTDITGSLGLTIRFEGVTIFIQQLRTLVKNPFPIRGDDPFTGRTLPGGGQLDRRTFIYGRNVTALTMSRNFTKHASQNVEVRCYVPERKRVIIARHPPFKKRQTKANPGQAGEQVYLVIRMTGINDKATLRRIAQEAYEQLNRNELTVSFETQNMASYGGGNDDPDILDMQPGDPIDIELQREEEELQGMTVNNLEDTLAIKQKAVDFLKLIGYSGEFAEVYAAAFVNTSLVTTFRLRAMDIDWDEDDGVGITCEAVNYAVIDRSDAELPEGEEAG